MQTRRNVLTAFTLALLSLILLQFQNCAPAAQSVASAPSEEIQIIDDFNKADLSFVSEDVRIHDEAFATNVSGFCQRQNSGETLKWSIWAGSEASGKPMQSGVARCQSGQFVIRLDELQDFVCDVDHLLVAEGELAGSTFTHVYRRCQPLASESVGSPDNSPGGTLCALEYNRNSELSSPCRKVCYREDKVVFDVRVDEARCSGLAARLAGP